MADGSNTVFGVERSRLGLLDGKKHIHFIGIGGSGMFPLAQILHGMGYYLTGSDNNETETLQAVRRMGIPVFMGQRAENIEGADLIVHTAAIMSDNPELIAARESTVPVIERSELLGLVTGWFDRAVCIAGTHGKTTTSSMLAQILLSSKEDFSCVLGGKLSSIGGSGRLGSGDIMVCESCEFVDTFLKLHPDIAVILNIDEDHLDYFKTLKNLKASFTRFARLASRLVIYNGGDENTLDALKGLSDRTLVSFGWDSGLDYSVRVAEVSGMRSKIELLRSGELFLEAVISVPGRHNALNACAAAAAADILGIAPEAIKAGLESFKGAIRRFEHIALVGGVEIADDYAHHPKEIEATLTAAKGLGYKRIIAVHQPFTYSRTATLLKDFAKALSLADVSVITDIMGSREKNTYGITSDRLVELLDNGVLTPDFDSCVGYLKGEVKPGDLVITMGCGDIYKVAKRLAAELSDGGKEG